MDVTNIEIHETDGKTVSYIKQFAKALLLHNRYTAWTVLLVSILLTITGWQVSKHYVQERAEERFAFEVEDASARIVARMLEYEQVLRGGATLFDTLERIPTRSEWREYITGLEIKTYYPGIQGIGVSLMYEPSELDAHIEDIRSQGFPEYQVRPPGDRELYSAIVYLEPFDWRNQRAFGYDMFSNRVRREAMEYARDTTLPAVSGRVTLVQETDKDVQAGFLVYLPVYEKGAAIDTIPQRRSALVGYVYSPFRMVDLMRGILSKNRPDVSFTLFDGQEEMSEATRLYSSPGVRNYTEPKWNQLLTIPLAGGYWTAEFSSTPAFEASVSSNQPTIIAATGLLVDVLLFIILRSLATERQRVHARAEVMVGDLKQVSERLQLAQKSAGFGIWEFDWVNREINWDERCHFLFGYDKNHAAPTHRTVFQHIYPEDISQFRHCIKQALSSDEPAYSDFRVVQANGEIRHLEVYMSSRRSADRKSIISIVGVALDSTEHLHNQQKLKVASTVFDHAQEGIMVTDANGIITDINPAFTQVTGYSREEVLGKTPRILKSGEHDKAYYTEMWRTITDKGFWRGKTWNRRKNGSLVAELQTINAIRDDNGKVTRYISVFTDITKMVLQQRKLEQMAHTDALTGLPNRVQLRDLLRQAMAAAHLYDHMLAVCYLDLDGFKPVNDRFGHAAGDQLLVDISQRLQGLVRGRDTIARLGGDEFVVLLSEIEDIEACDQTVTRLLDGLTGTYDIDEGSKVHISASIGVALYPLDDADADTLLRHADQAMYMAKDQGRACYHLFDIAKNQEQHHQRKWLERIDYALKDEEFTLFYQPKVDMRHGKVVGAEALIRWNHPELGILPPSEFLPHVVGTERAVAIDRWVINQALQQLDTWRQQGLDLKLSINIDGYHLQQRSFIESLRFGLLEYRDVPPSSLELEILESSALADMNKVSAVIKECRHLGLSVSIDDFGTGYSSLSYLKQLPADTLKIDRSFIRDIVNDEDNLAIVEGIIGLARAFDRNVIAEGVEEEEHGTLLLRMGCDFGQGYGIAKPMPAEDMIIWLKAYQQPEAWREAAKIYWIHNELREKENLRIGQQFS